jgi:DNA (cytosine-5)-methyltransferase 1
VKVIKFGDLFAGAGGYSVGLKSAGLKESFAVEADEWACDTLSHNLSCGVLHRDITTILDNEISKLPDVDVLVGGPPCQGFSVAGPSQYGIDDERNNLFMHFLRFAEIKRPYICIIENVPQLFTKKLSFGATALDVIRSKFEALGYCVETAVLDSSNFGVPQSRKRAFIAAYFKGVEFRFPHATHILEPDQISLFPDEQANKVTVWEAISDLPQIGASEGSDDLIPYQTDEESSYQEEMRKGSNGVSNHIAMKHTQRLIERFSKIKPGQSLKDVAHENGQKTKYTGETNTKPYKSNNQRLNPNKVCLAIPASFQSNFLHPYKDRNLTAREAARLMSFPDSYVFKGKRTCMSWEKNLSQYNQIGNAVCPLVARELGKSCINALSKVNRSQFKKPILTERITPIIDRIEERFENNKSYDIKNISFLNCIGSKMLGGIQDEDTFAYKGINIPLSYFPLAILIACSDSCGMCDSNKQPYGMHKGSIPFLISKEDFSSLAEKKYDNGLDYHLRKFGEFPVQVAHYVGEILELHGYVTIENMMNNERTGRSVRGMVVVKVPRLVKSISEKFQSLLEEKP